MSYPDTTPTTDALEVVEFLERHATVLLTALRVHAEEMDKAAQVAQEQYDAGQANPDLLAAQDASMITNRGYLHTAGLFRETAEGSRKIAEELLELLDGLEG